MKCEICGSELNLTYRNMQKKEGQKFYICPCCKLRWAPNLSVNRLFHSKLNEENRHEALVGVRIQEFEQINNIVDRYVKKWSRGLEVGCAYGWYLDTVRDKYNMEGIEPEKVIAERARANGHTVYTGFFPDDMPKSIEKYDFIVFNNVWEHINNVSGLIDATLKYLKKGGVIIVTVPLSTGGLYRIAEIFEKIGYTKWLARLWQLHFHSPHIYYFTKKNFETIMKNHGCKLEFVEDIRDFIDPKRMKQRFEMDLDEKHGGLKATIFQAMYPLIKRLPSDKAVFVYRYTGGNNKC